MPKPLMEAGAKDTVQVSPADADSDLDALRRENRQLRAQVREQEQTEHDLRAAHEELTAKVAALEQRIARMTKRIYGWSSERHHPGQPRIELEFAAGDLPGDGRAVASASVVSGEVASSGG